MPWNSSVFDVAQSCVTCFINALTHVKVEILCIPMGTGVNGVGNLSGPFPKGWGWYSTTTVMGYIYKTVVQAEKRGGTNKTQPTGKRNHTPQLPNNRAKAPPACLPCAHKVDDTTPIHDSIRESVTWECKEHGVKS